MKFLLFYLKKVLNDSEIYNSFLSFFNNQTKEKFNELKKNFISFTLEHTNIKKMLEPKRIFSKILNPLAFEYSSLGTVKGNISAHKITKDLLMYNRNNFRDIYADKPKDLTRKEYSLLKPIDTATIEYYKYQSSKAKRNLKKFITEFFNGESEMKEDDYLFIKGVHIHHIFPEADFPTISMFIENLIALTPSQHLSKAHPSGYTQVIDKDYQYLLLLAKSKIIEDNINQDSIPTIYDFDSYKTVLYTGYDNDEFLNVQDFDFSSIRMMITNKHISSIKI